MTRIIRLRTEPDMPPQAPLALSRQHLSRAFRDPAAPGVPRVRGVAGWRALVFLPAGLATLLIMALFTDFFAMGGLSPFETLLISLIAFSFFWIAMSVSMALAGALHMSMPGTPDRRRAAPLDVALLVPIHDEDPSAVFGNALAMLEDLHAKPSMHRFSLFVLSDTRDSTIAAEERRAFAALRRMAPPGIPVNYRNFPENTERKIGNIAHWVRYWGAAHEGMLVLDADSLMSAEAIAALADALSRDPGAGLIQSTPRIIGGETLFARIQQFATRLYGAPLSAGLAAWTAQEGNYWGHNAILRTRAFAASAGLPRIGRARRLIMSHDFVEAALLRRAGWAVRMLPAAPGSYEEAPATLVDYVRRDARWCRGNLQHLRLLATRGLHPVSRFHLFQGAMSYLVSPVWLALLLIWAAIGVGGEKSLIVYFSGNDPRPQWPELTGARQIALLGFMYGMLLAPKLIGMLVALLQGTTLAAFGGRLRFSASVVAEVALSVAYAPILMVQQTRAIFTSALGTDAAWLSVRATGPRPSLGELARFHAAETAIGTVLTGGILFGYVTLWLLPIGLSLALAVPLSRLSAVRLDRLMSTPECNRPPPIVRGARDARTRISTAIENPIPIAAE